MPGAYPFPPFPEVPQLGPWLAPKEAVEESRSLSTRVALSSAPRNRERRRELGPAVRLPAV